MCTCIVTVNFLNTKYNEKYIFAKQINILGLINGKNPITKVIKYPYPTRKCVIVNNNTSKTCHEDDVITNDENLINAKSFGNLLYHRIDLDLTKILKQFNIIIVHSDREKEFISNYVLSTSKYIINICKENNINISERENSNVCYHELDDE